MLNPLLLFSAHIIAILSVLLLAVGYLKTEPGKASARVFAVIAVLIVFYLLSGMTGSHIDPTFRLDLSDWQLIRQTGANAISGLFMVYCFLIFQEQQKFPLILALAYIAQISVDFILRILAAMEVIAFGDSSVQLIFNALSAMQLGFASCAIYWTLKGWRADLVEDRRIFRWFIIGVQGVLIFTIVLVENFLLEGNSGGFAIGQAIITYVIATVGLVMVLMAMHFDYVSLSHAIRRVVEPKDEPGQEVASGFSKESFEQVFCGNKLYREAGLTIAMLAKKLAMPEYRLRAFIHKQLGFRNFNAMLHKYRIEDAGVVLSSREQKHLPILTIALTVGYQSITPFNNAFREIKGVTPSEFRKNAITD
ncbi:MAG: helix-turn-helix domain-containing protein [Pseudohongiellaceae bacterium]